MVPSKVQENGYRYDYRYETFRLHGQWYWDLVVKCARWQHPAVRCGARFAVPAGHHLSCFKLLIEVCVFTIVV